MNSEQQEFHIKCNALIEEIKAREITTANSVKVGDYLIDHRGGNCCLVTKITPKTIKIKRMVCKRQNGNKGYVTAKERLDSFSKTSFEEDYIFYTITREEVYILARGWRIYFEYLQQAKEQAKVECLRLSVEFDQMENEKLDRLVEKYNLTKDCECINHSDPHWVHMQRYEISVSTKFMASISPLSSHAFCRNEQRRLNDLANHMEYLEANQN